MKTKTAVDTARAFKRIISKDFPKNVCRQRHRVQGLIQTFCESKGSEIYNTHSESKSAFAEQNLRSLKKSFTSIWKKEDLLLHQQTSKFC